MTLPVNTYNTTDQILKYTVIQDLRAQEIAFDEETGDSRSISRSALNQTAVQNIPAAMHRVTIENTGDVPITVEYAIDVERNFEIEAGGTAVLISEVLNGLGEMNVIPGSTSGDEVNSISVYMHRFV